MRGGCESEGEAPGGKKSSDDGDGDKGEDLLHKFFEDGGEQHKATTVATGLMVTMKGFCYSTKSMGVARRSVLSTATAVEARDWAQKHEAGKYSIN